MRSKLTDKHKFMALILNDNMGYSQQAIADFMSTRIPGGVSQPTVHNGIKEARYLLEINRLNKLYNEAKLELGNAGFVERPALIEYDKAMISIE